jgi:hypothetical protein
MQPYGEINKKLKNDIMGKQKEVNELFETVFLEQVDQELRNKLTENLSEIFGFEFEDRTQPEILDKQFLEFQGYNPKTKKVIVITVGLGQAN